MDSGQSKWEDSGAGGEVLLPTPLALFHTQSVALNIGHTPEGTPGWQMLACSLWNQGDWF